MRTYKGDQTERLYLIKKVQKYVLVHRDLAAINDGREFEILYHEIYVKKRKNVERENKSNTGASFLVMEKKIVKKNLH